MQSRVPAGAIPAVLTLTAAAVLLFHAWQYMPFISDDALISLRYSQRLLSGHGLTWTEGQPVEGYSNLLWVLLVALAGAAGMELVQAARVLGIVCSLGVIVALGCRYATMSTRGAAASATAIAAGFVALSAPMAVWAIGGLEQPLYAVLLAFSVVLLFSLFDGAHREGLRTAALGITLGLLCLTRPDGPIFTVATVAALVIGAPRDRAKGWRRRAVTVGGIAMLFPVAQLVFRVFYYGEFVPNTALVKIAPSTLRWNDGWHYLLAGIISLTPFSFLAIAAMAALLLTTRLRERGAALIALAGGWSLYLVFIGGDIFPAYRHIVPLVVIFAFALGEGAMLVASLLDGRRRAAVALSSLALLLLLPFAQRQFADKQSQRAMREQWEWDCRKLALVLKNAFERQQPLVAVTAAGCLPFWSELPALDMLGLNDYYLPRHPPPDLGTGLIGHELGDGAYVLGRAPDIIVFNVGSPPQYRSGEEMERMAEFRDEYVPVRIDIPDVEFPPVVYVRRSSAKPGIGISRGESMIIIPAFLLTGPGTSVTPDVDGTLVARLEPNALARLSGLPIDSSRTWTAQTSTADPSLAVEVATTEGSISVTLRSNARHPITVRQVVLTEN